MSWMQFSIRKDFLQNGGQTTKLDTNKDQNPEYTLNKYVRVYNQASAMDKVKPKLLPGKWEGVEPVGGLFKLRQKNHEIMVPRWMMKNEFA